MSARDRIMSAVLAGTIAAHPLPALPVPTPAEIAQMLVDLAEAPSPSADEHAAAMAAPLAVAA